MPSELRIGAVLLAAGGSSRMGTPKQLLALHGKTLIRQTAETVLGSGASPVVVVLGASSAAVGAELSGLPLQFAENTRWQEGMAGSIRAGLSGLVSIVDAVLIALCDQPFISRAHLASLVEAARRSPSRIVASETSETVGSPAIFPRRWFNDLLGLRGDEGGKKLVLAELSEVVRIRFEGAFDLDTPEDYERAKR